MHHKTAEVFAGGRSLQVPMVREVLHCDQQSQRVDDPHAYCWFKTVFRFDLTVTTYTIDDASKSLLYPLSLGRSACVWDSCGTAWEYHTASRRGTPARRHTLVSTTRRSHRVAGRGICPRT